MTFWDWISDNGWNLSNSVGAAAAFVLSWKAYTREHPRVSRENREALREEFKDLLREYPQAHQYNDPNLNIETGHLIRQGLPEVDVRRLATSQWGHGTTAVVYARVLARARYYGTWRGRYSAWKQKKLFKQVQLEMAQLARQFEEARLGSAIDPLDK